jgi:tetratricopeptide (TPR) repeat protein
MIQSTFLRSTVTLLALCMAAAPAWAGTGLDKWLGSASEVVISDIVDVPLYAAPDGSPVPCVMATIDGKPFLLAISGADSTIFLDERAVGALKLEPKTHNKKLINLKGEEQKFRKGGEIATAEVASIQIGGVELKGVTVLTKIDKDAESPSISELGNPSSGVAVDGMIGMGALPQLGYAVSVSQGVVRFAPASRAGELLTAVGGTSTPWQAEGSRWIKFGSEKMWMSPVSLLVNAQVGGQAARVALASANLSRLDSSVARPADAPTAKVGDYTAAWLDASVGDAQLGPAWVGADSGFELLGTVAEAKLPLDGVVGAFHLRGVDIAVDPAGNLSMKVARTAKRADPLPTLRDAAELALKESIEGKGDEAGKEKEEKADEADASKPKGDVAAYKYAADVAEATGDFSRAVALRKTVVDFDKRDCSGFHSLGQAQLGAADVAGALSSLRTASDLSHAWWDLTPDERKDLGEQIDKKGADKDALAPRQAASCYRADGDLAVAMLASGLMPEVEALYRGKLDLDGRVATAFGVGSILAGKATAAQEPYRQALKLERSPSVANRLGLGLAYEAAGDSATAIGHYERAVEVAPNDAGAVQLWLAAVARANGAEAAAKAGRELTLRLPNSSAAWFGAAWATSQSDATAVAGLQPKGDAFFTAELAQAPRNARLLATYARYLVVTGRVDAAREAANQAVAIAPSGAEGWVALADVETAAGDAAKATAALKRAGQANALHPAYAQGLGTH